MIHVRLKFRLTLLGPILTASTIAGRTGLDAVMARNADHHPYLPYSLVRGKLRQALEQLASVPANPAQKAIADSIPVWFGPRRADDDDGNVRSSLSFSDFVHPAPKPDPATKPDPKDPPVWPTRSRIKIDPVTGAAQEKMLMVLDAPFQTGEEATFEGDVWCICHTQDFAETTVNYLLAGFRWVRQFGAERTIGFGRVHNVELVGLEFTQLAAKTGPSVQEIRSQFSTVLSSSNPLTPFKCSPCIPISAPSNLRYGLRIRPRGPFCIAGLRKGGNIFDSEEIIPGGAILGAIATTWQQASGRHNQHVVEPRPGNKWNTLAANFSKLSITHAFPSLCGTNVRPNAIPLSLVAAEPWSQDIPDELYDVALCPKPRLIPENKTNTQRPPVFKPDWKSHVVGKKAKALFGWGEIPKELRVRTAIETETLRAAEEQLFAYQMVVPDKHEWLAYLDLSCVSSPDNVLDEMSQLLSAGLGPLGKTKIDAEFSIEPERSITSQIQSSPTPINGDTWVVTLQTPALLCSADDLKDVAGDGLHKGYQKTWDELSGSTLRLERFFAQQSLSAPRFAGRLPRDTAGNYYPFVLTDAGSTFILKATGEPVTAQDKIEQWLAHGVPVRADLLAGPSSLADWQRCPFLNRHGYGEIAVNAPWLTGSSPDWPTRLEEAS